MNKYTRSNNRTTFDHNDFRHGPSNYSSKHFENFSPTNAETMEISSQSQQKNANLERNGESTTYYKLSVVNRYIIYFLYICISILIF